MLFRRHQTPAADPALSPAPEAPAHDEDPRVEWIDGAPHYEGRPLQRPEDEVVDQGLSFDLATLVSRRRALSAAGLGATAFGLAACAPAATTGSSSSSASSAAASGSATPSSAASIDVASEIPDETAGPYPGDGSNGPDILAESGVVRSDLRTSFGTGSATAEGIPMTLELTLVDMANDYQPYAGAAVYVWHCDRDGEYSMYGEQIVEENYLRGVQIADRSGRVSFTSIFPACYSGRWPHIHFEVYPDQASITDSTRAVATSQLALPEEICTAVYATEGYERSVTNLAQVSLESDNVFSDDGGQTQLGKATGSVVPGYAVSLTAGVDTTTAPTGGSMPGGGGEGGPGAGAPPQG